MSPFSLILNLLTDYFHKILDPIGSKFVTRAEPGYRIFDEVPPPSPPGNGLIWKSDEVTCNICPFSKSCLPFPVDFTSQKTLKMCHVSCLTTLTFNYKYLGSYSRLLWCKREVCFCGVDITETTQICAVFTKFTQTEVTFYTEIDDEISNNTHSICFSWWKKEVSLSVFSFIYPQLVFNNSQHHQEREIIAR